jgi:hypothetical protein
MERQYGRRIKPTANGMKEIFKMLEEAAKKHAA